MYEGLGLPAKIIALPNNVIIIQNYDLSSPNISGILAHVCVEGVTESGIKWKRTRGQKYELIPIVVVDVPMITEEVIESLRVDGVISI